MGEAKLRRFVETSFNIAPNGKAETLHAPRLDGVVRPTPQDLRRQRSGAVRSPTAGDDRGTGLAAYTFRTGLHGDTARRPPGNKTAGIFMTIALAITK
jgi:hypothetical protein